MPYRNELRRAAIWLLIKSCISPTVTVTKLFGKDVNTVAYPWIELKDLAKDTKKYPINLLREAVDFLYEEKHIDYLENQIDRFDIKIKGTSAGENALKERVYQENINDYNHDRIYRTTRWAAPVLSFLLAVFTLLFTITKINSQSKQLIDIQVRLRQLELALPVKPAAGSTSNPAKIAPHTPNPTP